MAARVRDPGTRLPLGLVLVLVDVVAVLAIAGAAGLLDRTRDHHVALVATLLSAVVAGGFAHAAGLHRPRLVLSLLADLPGLVATALVATLVLAATGRLLGSDLVPGWGAGSALAVAMFSLLVLLRAVAYALVSGLRRWLMVGTRVLVVGTGPVARRLAHTLLAHPEHGLTPVGFVADGRPGGRRGLSLPLVGTVAGLPRAMIDTQVHSVLLALPGRPDEDELAAVTGCLVAGVAVWAAPRFDELTPGRLRQPRETVGEVSVVRLHRRGASAATRAVRRLAGAVVAAVTLVVLAPVVLVVAVLVRVETGPGVIVRQPWVDEAGRAAMVPKFRTRRGTHVHDDATSWQIGNAGRIGPIGRLLRRTRLDELPAVVRLLSAQLWVLPIRTPRPRPAVGMVGASVPPGSDEAQVDAGHLAR